MGYGPEGAMDVAHRLYPTLLSLCVSRRELILRKQLVSRTLGWRGRSLRRTV